MADTVQTQDAKQAIFRQVDCLLSKPFGNLIIKKHQNEVTIDITDKRKLTISK